MTREAGTVDIEVKSPQLRYCFFRVPLTLFAGGSEITFDRPQDEQAWQRNHAELLSIRLCRGGNYATVFAVLAAVATHSGHWSDCCRGLFVEC